MESRLGKGTLFRRCSVKDTFDSFVKAKKLDHLYKACGPGGEMEAKVSVASGEKHSCPSAVIVLINLSFVL